MVKITSSSEYPSSENEEKYKFYFEKYSYPLHIFQKHAIQGIVEQKHVLITAHTGSGKTLPGEFAIDYWIKTMGKKVIYTAPIKALSNQKYYDFTQKYPDISFGILTGDLKCNPEADCLIMTTEILLNKLYNIGQKNTDLSQNSQLDFEMDIANDLGCVVFDEVHYINDPSRGHVWEQTIMLLPQTVCMVMLSATIEDPLKFASWCETQKKRELILTTNLKRSVPLTHYMFITSNNSIFKQIKDKKIQQEIRETLNQFWCLKDAQGKFNEPHFHKVNKTLTLLETNRIIVKRTFVLNQLTEILKEKAMLPALCFVYSRKQVLQCAKELTTILLNDDSKVPYIIEKECQHLLRKFPNFQEYLELPEYVELISLLGKGIGIHHAGMLPPFREIVEILFSKGFIQILFCTETLSVGINMPVKTTIFTSLEKYDGEHMRYLQSHEYTQSAGRAGRLGLDTVGHVIHLNNLFKSSISLPFYKGILSGKSQTFTSKFKISYSLLLRFLGGRENEEKNTIESFFSQSLLNYQTEQLIKPIHEELLGEKEKLNKFPPLKTPIHLFKEYENLEQQINTQHKLKEQTKLKTKQFILTESNPSLSLEIKSWNQICLAENKIINLLKQIEGLKEFVPHQINNVFHFLENKGFILHTSCSCQLTEKGKIATEFKEMHCLAFAEWIQQPSILLFTPIQMVGFLSCFTNIAKVKEDFDFKEDFYCNDNNGNCNNNNIDDIIGSLHFIEEKYKEYDNWEQQNYMDMGNCESINNQMIPYFIKWCESLNGEECRLVLKEIEYNLDISAGEFVKMLLKINNMALELEKVCELSPHLLRLKHCFSQIPSLTLKYIATNQSLYV